MVPRNNMSVSARIVRGASHNENAGFGKVSSRFVSVDASLGGTLLEVQSGLGDRLSLKFQ